jgi:hypothetical protein
MKHPADILELYNNTSCLSHKFLVILVYTPKPCLLKRLNGYFILLLLCSVNLFSQNNFSTVRGITYKPEQENLKTDPGLSVQNGTNAIQTHYTVTACGLNFVTSSVMLCKRGGAPAGTNQPATFVVSGIPVCFQVQAAFFYTGGSGSGPAINLSFTNPLATNSVFPMVNSGYTATDKWGGYGGTWTRRADVTALISGNGNYVISGIPTGSPNDPDGGTLVIVYSDNTQTYTGHMILADGTMAAGGGGNLNSVISGFNICANPTLTQHYIIAGDFQSIGIYNLRYNSLANNSSYPSAAQSFYAYLPFTGAAVTAGQTTANYGLNNSSADAFAFYAAGLYYRTTCNACPGGVCAVLPIELLNFNAKCAAEKVDLRWETATEINNDHFTIERSTNGINYETIGTIAGAGNSKKTIRYSFADPKPLKGTSYYSLRQTDHSGESKILETAAVSCTGISEFAIHPNPSTGIFSIDGAEQNSEIIITDVLGKIMLQTKITAEKTEIDLNDQVNGIYFVKVISESGITSNKIVVNK